MQCRGRRALTGTTRTYIGLLHPALPSPRPTGQTHRRSAHRSRNERVDERSFTLGMMAKGLERHARDLEVLERVRDAVRSLRQRHLREAEEVICRARLL